MASIRDVPIDLFRRKIPADVIALLPASVARECGAIPVACDAQVVIARAVSDTDTFEKLRFILNRSIVIVQASPEGIAFALQKYYPSP